MIPRAVCIQAIRGFQAEQVIPLSPTLTVIYGENGRGKTSLCEGWNWLFTGGMLEGLEPRSEVDSAGRNIHVRLQPRMRLLDEEGAVLVERSDEHFSNPAHLPDSTSPVLLQYRLHQVLYSSQGERRQFFEDVLELGVESAFSQTLRRACLGADPFEEEAWKTWKRATAAVKDQAYAIPHREPSSRSEQEENKNHLIEFLSEYFECDPNPEALEAALEAGTGKPDLPLDDVAPPISAEVETDVQQALSAIEKLDAEAAKALTRIRWQKQGLELVEPPHCPFCGEATADQAKIESIRTGVLELESRHAEHRKAKSTLEKAVTSVLPLAELDVDRTTAHLERLRARVGDLGVEDAEDLLDKLNELNDQLDRLADARPEAGSLGDPKVFTEFSSAALDVSQAWLAFGPELEKLKRTLEGKRVRVRYMEAAASVLQYSRADRNGFYRRLDARVPLAELARAAPEVVGRLKAERLARVADDIIRFYRVLRPGDPTPLEQIQSAGGVRGDIRILARSRDKVEHASALFSHSNANALGMAAHIARVLDAGHRTVVLDDPFQSLDSSNWEQVIRKLVSALLDDGLQVVILTHQRKAAEALLDRYVEQGALGTQLRWDSESGPIPEPMYPAGDRQLTIVLDGLERDDPSEIPKVASALRHLIEGFCCAYLGAVGGELPPAHRRNLGQFIEKLEGLHPDVRPRPQTLEDLKEWNRILSDEAHVDGAAAPGMDQLKEVTRGALEAQGQEKQLRPPNVGDWKRIPQAPALKARRRAILGSP